MIISFKPQFMQSSKIEQRVILYFLYALYISVYIWFLFEEFTPYVDYTIYNQAVTRFFNGEQF